MNNTFYIHKHCIWKGSDNFRLPNVDFVPALIRRRLTSVEKVGLFLAHCLEPLDTANCIVFASQFGEWQQTVKLIRQMHDEHEMSPAGFSHSVHNAMPGLLAMVDRTKYNYTTIAANEKTIDCALVEAVVRGDNVLFIYAEEETPDFYKNRFGHPFYSHGCAFLLSAQPAPNARKIHIETTDATADKCTVFEELADFLGNKKELRTEFYVLRDAK